MCIGDHSHRCPHCWIHFIPQLTSFKYLCTGTWSLVRWVSICNWSHQYSIFICRSLAKPSSSGPLHLVMCFVFQPVTWSSRWQPWSTSGDIVEWTLLSDSCWSQFPFLRPLIQDCTICPKTEGPFNLFLLFIRFIASLVDHTNNPSLSFLVFGLVQAIGGAIVLLPIPHSKPKTEGKFGPKTSHA